MVMMLSIVNLPAFNTTVQAAETVVPDDLHIQYDAENDMISWDAVEWGVFSGKNMYRVFFYDLENSRHYAVDTSKNQITLGEVLEEIQIYNWTGTWNKDKGVFCNSSTRDIGIRGDFRIEVDVHYMEKDAITGSNELRTKKTKSYEYNLEYTLYNAMPDFAEEIRLVRNNKGNPILKWKTPNKPGGNKVYDDYALLIQIIHDGNEYYWGADSNTIGTGLMHNITRETQLDLTKLEQKLKEIGETQFGVYISTRSLVDDRGIGRVFATHYSAVPYFHKIRLEENQMDYPVCWGNQKTEPYKAYWNLEKWNNIVNYQYHTFQLELAKRTKGADGRYYDETLYTRDLTESEKSGSIDFTKEILEHGNGEYLAKITQHSTNDSRFYYYDYDRTYFYIEDYLKLTTQSQESGEELTLHVGNPLTIGYSADVLPIWLTKAGYSLSSPIVHISFDKYDGDVNLYNSKTSTPSWTQTWTPSKSFAGDRATITYSVQLVDSYGHAGPYSHISNTFYANILDVEKTEENMPKFTSSPKNIVLKNNEKISTIQWTTDKTISDDMSMYLMVSSDGGKTFSSSAAKLTDVKNDGTCEYNCRSSYSNTRYWYILDIRQSTGGSGYIHSYSDPFSITWTNDGNPAMLGPVDEYNTILNNGTDYQISIPFNFGKNYGDDVNKYTLYYLRDGVYENVAGAGYNYKVDTSRNTLNLTIYSDESNFSSDMTYKMVVKNKYSSTGLSAIGSLSTEFQVQWVPAPVALTEFAITNVADGRYGENVNAVALIAEAMYGNDAHYNINYGWRAHISKKIDDKFVPIDQQEGENAEYYQEKYNAGEYKVTFILEANANGDKSNCYDFDKENLHGTINGKDAIIEFNQALGSDSVEISYVFSVENHDFSQYVSNGDGTHKVVCKDCGATQEGHDKDACSGGTATCKVKAKCSKCGEEYGELATHTFKWIIDKAATTTATGLKHEECSVCGYKKSAVTIAKDKPVNPKVESISNIFGVDDSSAEKILQFVKDNNISDDTLKITEKVIVNRTSDNDIKGSAFGLLKARITSVKKNSMKVKWSKIKGADGYIIYTAPCGKKNKLKKVRSVSAKSTSATFKKLKKGTYYKFLVIAYKKVGNVKVTMSVSKTIHATTTGGKYGVAKSVKINKIGNKKNVNKVTLKKGKSTTVKATEVRQIKNKKIQKHRGIKLETSNPKFAVIKGSKIIAKGKGKCTVYAYAQNGVYTKITVTVK